MSDGGAGTDEIHPLLLRALSPVLADVRATAAGRVDIKANDWSTYPGQLCAFAARPDGTGAGVFVLQEDLPSHRVVQAAEQIQEIVMEGSGTTWPRCPEHPSTHPLVPVDDDESGPVWRCPTTNSAVCAIGGLSSTVSVIATP